MKKSPPNQPAAARSRPRPGQVGKAPHAPGESGAAQPGLRLPHERDQSTDATSDAPDPVMRQAHDDLAAGQVDTDLRQTPGLDAEQRKKLLRKQP